MKGFDFLKRRNKIMVMYLCSVFMFFGLFVNYGNKYLVSERIEKVDLETVIVEDFDNNLNQDFSNLDISNVEQISVKGLKYRETKSDYRSIKTLATRNILNESDDDKYYRIFGEDNESKRQKYYVFYSSDEEAREDMEAFNVKVWNIDSEGNWYKQSFVLEMHKNVVDIVKMIFDELLALPENERVPIKTMGGYHYRTGMSCHTCGVAIDINWEENAEMTIDGVITTGSYWKPYEDIYSIPSDSKLVEIFAKYGFGWGGTWTNKKDYMHFSYFNR